MSPRPTNSAGKRRRSPKTPSERVEVLSGGDAAEQHDLAAAARGSARAGARRAAAARGSARSPASMSTSAKRAEPRARPPARRRARSPSAGVMTSTPGTPGGRPREGVRVGELAAEVEPAEEGEHVAERGAGGRAQPHARGRSAPRVEDEPRPLAAAVRGREQEDAAPHRRRRRRHRAREARRVERVEHLAAAHPAAARHRHAVAEVVELAGGVGVGGDDERDARARAPRGSSAAAGRGGAGRR